LKKLEIEPGKSPLGGNSLIMDRNFLARDIPEFEKYFHYRVIDVSSIKELTKRWYPKVYFSAPEKSGNHRALGDALDSINELRYYREHIFLQDVKSSVENL
jgi:oligoribonuclease